ncbi:hypothetical protein AAE026_08105 [Bradyrhizobium sp. DN5]|uniref:hypothetical protein n=1 Tax=Bradyrhizobium sp. DN5 TaxID=3056950 RepID=UPI003526C30A
MAEAVFGEDAAKVSGVRCEHGVHHLAANIFCRSALSASLLDATKGDDVARHSKAKQKGIRESFEIRQLFEVVVCSNQPED